MLNKKWHKTDSIKEYFHLQNWQNVQKTVTQVNREQNTIDTTKKNK